MRLLYSLFPRYILFKVYCLESLIRVLDDSVQMGPDPIIPNHTLGQRAWILVTVLSVMLILTYLSIHKVKSTQTCSDAARGEVLVQREDCLSVEEVLGVVTHGAV